MEAGVSAGAFTGVPHVLGDEAVEDAGVGEQRIEGDEELADVAVLIQSESIQARAQTVEHQVVAAEVAQSCSPVVAAFIVEDVERGHPAAQGDDVGDSRSVADVLVAQPAADCGSAEFVVDQDEMLGGWWTVNFPRNGSPSTRDRMRLSPRMVFPALYCGGKDDVALFGCYLVDAVADGLVGFVEQGGQWCDRRVGDGRKCLGVDERAGVAFESDLFGADADGVGAHIAVLVGRVVLPVHVVAVVVPFGGVVVFDVGWWFVIVKGVG